MICRVLERRGRAMSEYEAASERTNCWAQESGGGSFTHALTVYCREFSPFTWKGSPNVPTDLDRDARRRQVKQFGPVTQVCMDDYGCDLQWLHGFGSYLEEWAG